MFKDLFKNYIYPISVFSGGMIGVGFLSLPYVAMKVGIWVTLLYFMALTALVVVINLIFCEISLKTPDFKRFPGFIDYYLGRAAGMFSMFSGILATIGVLLVYLIISGEFLSSVFQPFFSGSVLTYVFIYFFIVSAIIYFDIKVVAKAEFLVIIFLFLSLVFVFIGGFSHIKLSNIFTGTTSVSNLFLPYGPLLFALWGAGLIPEVEEMIKGQKKRLKRIITIATLIVSVFYILFVLLILGISGPATDQTALAGLKNFLPGYLVSIALLMGVLATFTAFIMQGTILKKTLMFDLKLKHWQAFVITCCPPLILYLAEVRSFISLLSIIGGVLLGINGVMVLMIYRKIGGKKILVYPLLFVFILGIIYEIIYFIK